MGAFETGKVRSSVRFEEDWGEYVVRVTVAGVPIRGKDGTVETSEYRTDDRTDAMDTAARMVAEETTRQQLDRHQGELMSYMIEVETTATFTRTFEVEAVDEWAALAAYRAGGKEVEWVKDSLDDDLDCDENEDTVCVFTNDDTQTLLIDMSTAVVPFMSAAKQVDAGCLCAVNEHHAGACMGPDCDCH
jgi:hypothetical protein